MEESNYVCRVCNKEFKYQRNIDLHLKRVHGIEPEDEGNIFCPEGFCKFSCKDQFSLRDHLCTIHKYEVCQACSKVFKDKKTMHSHLKKKHGIYEAQEKISCPQDFCNCNFLDYLTLTDHLRTIHKMEISSNTCLLCSKTFRDRRNTYQHVRKVHGVDPQIPGRITCKEEMCKCSFNDYSSYRDHMSTMHDLEVNGVMCQYCPTEFKDRKNMYTHLRKVHRIDPEIHGQLLCPETSCESNFKEFSNLRKHLSSEHKLVIQKEEYSFCNETDFLDWKECIESETNCFYTLYNRANHVKGKNKKYYMCHRSGLRRPATKPNAKRRKLRDGVKMGSHCPSTLEVWEEDNKIHLVHYSTHFGHKNELKYLRISKSERSELAKKLSEGMSKDRCLEEIHNSLSGELKRIHLITKKDLWNICKAERICPKQKSPDDNASSITNWVKEDKASQRNLSIFYKPKGSTLAPLNEEDLVLVIMSPPQKEMYMKFCKSAICVDSTLGTNAAEFQLTSIVVVDEFGDAFLAALCLSNRVDQCAMEIFFDAVAKATTTATPDVFMSDNVPSFYNAWKEVNGNAKHQLLCPWHVERNWRKAIFKIPSKEKKVNIYKLACALLEEIDVSRFKALLNSFLQELAADKLTKNFGLHFEKVYANRPEAWALCYRLESGINGNLYFEAIHKVLEKYQQLDRCIDHLLKMVRDKMFSRLIQLVEDEESSMIDIVHGIIHDRHEKSLELPSTIEAMNSTSWKIRPPNEAYIHTVSKVVEDCSNCPLKCSYCDVCIHKYNCTCYDYSVELNMCEHIHFVLSKLQDESQVLTLEEASADTNIPEPVETIISETPKSTTVNLQRKIDFALSLIQDNNCDMETSQKIEELMDNALSLLNRTKKRKTDPPHEAEKVSPNKKMKLPRLFFIKEA